MRLFRRPRAHDVFTPGDLPLEKNNVYISRTASEGKLRRALERNACPVVFGDYGVGKTTLVRRYFHKEERPAQWFRLGDTRPKKGRVVYFSSAKGLTLGRVFEHILHHLEYRVSVETSTERRSGLDYGYGDRGVSLVATRGKARSETSRLVVSAPTDEALLRIMDESRLVVIVDELHLSSTEFRAELVSFVKATRVSAKNSSIVLIGTVQDAADIVAMDEGVDRFIADTPVGTMSDGESFALVENGFEKLRLLLDETLATMLVQAAAGAPATLQSLCLDTAEAALNGARHEVVREDIIGALHKYTEDHNSRMTRRYIAAIETQGEKRYRKQILHSVASLEGEYATMEQIREAVSARLGEDVKPSALSGPLRDLKTEQYGAILQDFRRDSGERVQNLSSFTDPMMKSYVRFMETVTGADMLNEDDVRERLA